MLHLFIHINMLFLSLTGLFFLSSVHFRFYLSIHCNFCSFSVLTYLMTSLLFFFKKKFYWIVEKDLVMQRWRQGSILPSKTKWEITSSLKPILQRKLNDLKKKKQLRSLVVFQWNLFHIFPLPLQIELPQQTTIPQSHPGKGSVHQWAPVLHKQHPYHTHAYAKYLRHAPEIY